MHEFLFAMATLTTLILIVVDQVPLATQHVQFRQLCRLLLFCNFVCQALVFVFWPKAVMLSLSIWIAIGLALALGWTELYALTKRDSR